MDDIEAVFRRCEHLVKAREDDDGESFLATAEAFARDIETMVKMARKALRIERQNHEDAVDEAMAGEDW
jgi:hypothetical protein